MKKTLNFCALHTPIKYPSVSNKIHIQKKSDILFFTSPNLYYICTIKKFKLTTMKKIAISCLFVLSALSGSVQAQEVGKVRVGFNFGYAIPDGGGGISYSLEPKYNLKENMMVGLKFGAAGMLKNIEGEDGAGTFEADLAATGYYLGTFDYYFHKSGSFAPYVGAGMGIFKIAALEVNNVSFAADNKFGGLLRCGFELGKFRLGAEYNLIPNSDLEDLNGNAAGESKNSYINIHLGFFFGGGQWSNK